MATETPLSDPQAWTEEAQAVIKDVENCVEFIQVSPKLQSSNTNIYLNVTTVEGDKVTVSLSGQGFAVVGRGGHDLNDLDPAEEDFRETPYSLLSEISPGFTKMFGSSLVEKLTQLKNSQEEGETD